MTFYHKFLMSSNFILQIIRSIGIKLGLVSKNRLRVLIYHDIPKSEEDAFKAQLNWLKKKWNIISPSQFGLMISGEKPIIGDNLLITFDDGLISNRIVAEKILNPLDIKVIFFVVSDFISIENSNSARKFIANHFFDESKISTIPDSWQNMNWEDLKILLHQGHSIGSHTKKHARLSNCNSILELEKEIISSADIIKKKLGIKVEHFAFTFGDIGSFSLDALKVARSRFDYIFTGIRGNNDDKVSPLAIRRDSAAYQLFNNEYVLFNNRLLDAFLSGFADFKYSSARKIIDRWCKIL